MKYIGIFFIEVYQKTLSKLMYFLGVRCRFYPTCSEYSKKSLKKYGFIKGTIFSIKRILRCNPWGGSGFDDVK